MVNWSEVQNARINTAGAYVYFQGLFLFAMGIHPHDGKIPIVRLGGHLEEQETGWQCARREVHEEPSLQIEPIRTQTTYLSDWDHPEADLQEIRWEQKHEKEPDPLLVVTHRSQGQTHLSLMYLAHAEGIPTPSSEVKGLILLETKEIHLLCREQLTLKQFLNEGGRAVLNAEFDTNLVLEPFAQLRLLARILNMDPEPETGFATKPYPEV